MRHEEEADAITRDVLVGIRTTFITPFDRGDIQDLITSMDDAIDQMQKTAKAIVLFEITTFEPEMRAMADAIVQCASSLREPCRCWRTSGRMSDSSMKSASR